MLSLAHSDAPELRKLIAHIHNLFCIGAVVAMAISGTAFAQHPPVDQAVASPCIWTQDGDHFVCGCQSPTDAPAYVFPRGLEYDGTYSTVCLTNLGLFNAETGTKVANNFDAGRPGYVLNGKYLRTDVVTQSPAFSRFAATTNDFRINPAGTSVDDARFNSVWGSEVHLYYYLNDYRTRFLSPSFIDSLGLNSDARTNLLHRQYRPDMQGLANARLPYAIINETPGNGGVPWSFDPLTNIANLPSARRLLPADSLNSLAYDPEWIVGQYAGAASNWITAGTAVWPVDSTWGNVGNLSWRTDIRPAVVEGLKLWSAYRYSGHTEVYKYAQKVRRIWASAPCDGRGQPACDKGWNIDNVGMYLDSADPGVNNPTNPNWPAGNSDDTLLFPFGTNYSPYNQRGGVGSVNHMGPTNAGLGGMFVGAIFYDISKEVGLGDAKADKLFWKTISLIDPGQPLSMTTFGQKVQQAARALWPTTGNPNLSWYEQDIVDVFASRGVKMNGVANFTDNIPLAIGMTGNPGPGALLTANAAQGFGSALPESQRNSSTGYNFLSFFQNGYQVTTPGTQYVTYQFYKYSKYGPEDQLDLTNGTINTVSSSNPVMNYDGSLAASYKGRSLGNTLVASPGQTLRFLRRRQSSVSEAEGYYAEDVRPLGFRVVKAIPNGFTFSVQRIGYALGGRISYRLTIVDPSLSLTGPNTGAATYSWNFTEFDGTVVSGTGQQVVYNARTNEPFTLTINRVRAAQTDTVTLRERGNDLDRNSGRQFNQDYWNAGYPVSFDTIVNRRLVEGHGSYNSALNPVGGAFGVQGRRWTTPNQVVKPLTFTTVSHGIGSGSNQNQPYRFQDAVYYNACIWGSRSTVTNFPGCLTDQENGNFEIQVPYSQVTGINLTNPFAIVTAGGYPGQLWTVNYPAEWRLQPNREYHFASHISASVVNNGYSYNVCSYAQANWDGANAGNEADRSDWLAGANWSGQAGAPPPQTMRQYLSSSGSVSNCTYSAYRFTGVTVPN